MPWNPAAKHMAKLDDLGKQATDRLRASRNADSSSSIGDRFKAATSGAGQTSIGARWEKETQARRAQAGSPASEDAGQASQPQLPERRTAPAAQPFPSRPPPPPQRNSNANSPTPQPPPPTPARNPAAAAGRPPLPPHTSTGGSGNSASRPPPPPARPGSAAQPPPSLPPRMNNEAGTANPPPPYNPVASRGEAVVDSPAAPPPPARRGPPPVPVGRKPVPGTSTSPVAKGPPPAVPRRSTQPSQDAPTTAFSSMSLQSNGSAAASAPPAPPPAVAASHTSAASSLGPLTASRHPADQPCQALSAATFFCYPGSFPEWQQSPPWFAAGGAAQGTPTMPPQLVHTNDRQWKAAAERRTQRRPDGRTESKEMHLGCVLFGDLSSLWYRITFDSANPADSFECNVAYSEPPTTPWKDSGLLQASAASYGELVARFCEAREGSVVGNGECWTLANDALTQVNQEQGWPEESCMLTSVGRTHGHLIYHASADIAGQQPQRAGAAAGLWRGGDVGNVRRGDIIEWDGYAECKLLDPPGASANMGNRAKGWPEHTAVIVGVGRTPTNNSGSNSSSMSETTPFDPAELGHLEVLEQSAGVPVSRKLLDLRAGSWTKGTMHIYRPVGRDAYLEGKVEPRAWDGYEGQSTRRKGWEPLN